MTTEAQTPPRRSVLDAVALKPGGRLERIRRRLVGSADVPQRRGLTAYVLFIAVLVGYVLQQLASQASIFANGSMWAEMATNYYQRTLDTSWFDQLFATDAGYIPLPQRIIALVLSRIGVSTEVIPYAYTMAGLVLGGLLVAAICLPHFRPLIGNDFLRAAAAAAILLIADFETRTFINFTYFAIVFTIAVGALAIASPRRVPAWAWVLPLLMISKPAVITVLPFVLFAAILSGRRFRLIALVSSVAALVQLATLWRSLQSASLYQDNPDSSLFTKGLSALTNFLGWLATIVLGQNGNAPVAVQLVVGAVVLALVVLIVIVDRRPTSALVIGGLSAVLFGCALNATTYSLVFTSDLSMVTGVTDRRVFGVIEGLMVVVVALVATLSERRWHVIPAREGVRRWMAAAGVVVFLAWFVLAGWAHVARAASAPHLFGSSGVSEWQRDAGLLDAGVEVVCTPIDPFGWVAGRDCGNLDFANSREVPLVFVPGRTADEITLEAPVGATAGQVESLAIVVRPGSGDGTVSGTVTLVSADGSEIEMVGQADVPAEGGILQFDAPRGPATDVVEARISFDAPVSVAEHAGAGGQMVPAVLWMGR
ncbi:hypothetical protein ACFJGV_05510 [Cnuibacter sp. UC19_7]|uniref:hypothetical protein n=1 Tax=Cnuibacter sp. UC19_7 TaxID=3350166 RepID=UPI00366A8126